jgi:hypothetical protein
MTHGRPNGGGGRSAGRGGLFAARSADSRLRVAGVVLCLTGLAMVVFSFFPWADADDDTLSVSVTGLGSVSVDASEQRIQESGIDTEQIEDRSKAPGAYTVVLGLALAIASIAVAANRFPGLGAAVGLVLSLIAVFLSLEYLFAPGDAVLDGAGDTGVGYAALGLWLVTVSAVVALAVAVTASIWGLRSAPAATARPARRADRGRTSSRSATASIDLAGASRATGSSNVAGTPAQYRPPPRLRPDSGRWPEPGYRARSDDTTGRLDRRPDVTGRPTEPYYRPGPDDGGAVRARPQPAGYRASGYPPPRSRSGGEQLSRNQPPRNQPPRDQAPRNQPPRDQAPRNQPPRDQAPRNQPPRTQPPRTQPPRTQPPSEPREGRRRRRE